MLLNLLWLENFIKKTMVVYCFFNKILSKQPKGVSRSAPLFLAIALAFSCSSASAWTFTDIYYGFFPPSFGDPYAPGAPKYSPGYVAPVGDKVKAGVVAIVVGSGAGSPPPLSPTFPANTPGYNLTIPMPSSIQPPLVQPTVSYTPAAAAGGGVNVSQTTPVTAAPHPAGVAASAADIVAANAKAGSMPASANVNTTGNIPSNFAAKAGSAALFAGSLASLATPAGLVMTLANLASLGVNGKALWDLFMPAENLMVDAAGLLQKQLSGSAVCSNKAGAPLCAMPTPSGNPFMPSCPVGYGAVIWFSGAPLYLNTPGGFVTCAGQIVIPPTTAPMSQAEFEVAMLNAVTNSNVIAAQAVQAALEANHAVQVSNLQSAANVPAIASQWNQISQIVDALGNVTTTLARTVTNIAPAAAVAPTYTPSVQNVTIVNGAPTLQTTINNPAAAPLEKPKTQCEVAPDSLGCDSNVLGDVPLEPLAAKDINVSIVPYLLPSSYLCPPPIITVGVGGVSHTFDLWRQPCAVAVGIHPILIAFAWLAAAGILVRRL